ncbi:MAG: hypothetical protein N3B14_03605 [Thermoleophilia bacterium]|nr:hypothetical protein [Thermoleophilia bacterium]
MASRAAKNRERSWVIVCSLFVGVACAALLIGTQACGQERQEAQVSNVGNPTSVQQVDAKDADAVRALSAAYWEAWNAYDVEKVLSMLAEPFRSEREEEIKANIEKLKRWKMSISVTEVEPPRLDQNGEIVMFVHVKKPLSTDRTQMRFRKAGSSWVIVYASKD